MTAIEIVFRGMDSSEFVEKSVRDHADHLVEIAPEISRCRVVLQAPTPHHNHGQPFHVRLEVHVPGDDIVIDRDPGRGEKAHTDIYVAITDTFHQARRQLEERGRKKREERRRQNGVVVPTE